MKYDLIVIGGGPAGMMAAGRAGERGLRVLLLEKNLQPGRKLLLSGGGRCNLTNEIENLKEISENYGENGKFLFSSFSFFGTKDTILFFENLGLKLKKEENGRIFPENNNSSSVLDSFLFYLKNNNVELRLGCTIKEFLHSENKIKKIILESGEDLMASNYLIATGGKSYPQTGSSGDGYVWAEKMGHKIIKPAPALAPILVKEKDIKNIEGLSLKKVEVSLHSDKKKILNKKGDIIFTANGLSGPLILNISKEVSLRSGSEIKISIDLFPEKSFEVLDKVINNGFRERSNSFLKNNLENILPPRFILYILNRADLDPNKKTNLVTREERQKIISIFKSLIFEISASAGFEKAMVTAGGVDLREVDPKNMRSKIINNLYFCGEVLDIDGPTGGYNLQACFSTGYAAGNNVK